MSKNKKNNSTNTRLVEFNKGVIKDNVLAALVTSDLFKHKVFKKKKGKGSCDPRSSCRTDADTNWNK